MARPSGQDFPKHKGGLIPKFRKCPDLVDRIFQNIRADFLEILEIRKVRGKNFGNFGIEFGRADRHSSDDRPCTTTQLRGHGLSTGGATIYIYIYTQHISICIYDMYMKTYVHVHTARTRTQRGTIVGE